MDETEEMQIDPSTIDRDQIGEGELTEEEEIYKENILDHYKHPHNSGKLASCSFDHKEHNPICGDIIHMYVEVDDKHVVSDVTFEGDGCAISQASVSMLTDFIKGKPLEDLKKITREDILGLLGIKIGVVRMKCALLSLKTLHKGIEGFEGKKHGR